LALTFASLGGRGARSDAHQSGAWRHRACVSAVQSDRERRNSRNSLLLKQKIRAQKIGWRVDLRETLAHFG